CRKLALDNMALMTKDFKRLGVWMDFENAYQPIHRSFIEGEWWLIKKAHENNRLYEGEKTMHWCPKCATALAKHELEYKNVTDESIFLKFQIEGKENEYLVIWTTTPWTIPYNLGVMVHPELEYIKAKVDGEIWVIAKGLANIFLSSIDKKFEIVEEFKGESLKGLRYIHPLYNELKEVYDELKSKSPNVFTVVLSEEYVDLSAGTGLVHMAPGCGPEDYEIGHRNNILPFNNLHEDGVFPENMGKFAGWTAKKDDNKFIDYFKEIGTLITSNPVEHEYAHCWRCKKPVIFRTTKQWFFKIEDLKDQMRELNKNIKWQPDWAGNRQFDAWLDNLRDNSITKQRYWGCPIPVWKCDKCGDYVVVGSVKELEELGGKVPEDLHKPWIDEVELKCKCGEVKKRIPDILDVWVDAGSTSWTCLDYPQKEELFNELWPADFILEGKDQIRGWFNLLFVTSMVSMNKPSYKAVYMHGFVNDTQGRKMSKSLGNYILPQEVVDKYGADTFRYYSIGGSNPGEDLNYNFDDMKVKHRNLMVLWNLHKFLIDLANEVGKSPQNLDDVKSDYSVEEKYIVSKLHSTIKNVTELFEEYKLNEIPWKIEELFLALSRTYIQLVREKANKEEGKKVVLVCVYETLIEILKLLAPIAPMITEKIFLNLKQAFNFEEESVHVCSWPKADEGLIDAKLEEKMAVVGDVIQAVLFAREKVQRGLRWPLKEAIVVSEDEKIVEAVNELQDIIKLQTNIKGISVIDKFDKEKETVKADYAKIAPEFKTDAAKVIAHLATSSPETILGHVEKQGKYEFSVDGKKFAITKNHLIIAREAPPPFKGVEFRGGRLYINQEKSDELEAEGYAREIMRRIQSLRKKGGLVKSDKITLFVGVDEELKAMLEKWEDQIKEKVGADNIRIDVVEPGRKHELESEEKIKDHKVRICFDKLE
ncbi:isoleucine--tRNA ligase, partial [Candidatus Woesearchaeota archaeon]|nr:isoleucine--tRNA ligase [Candidatus Woesearchaeota archaeon]